MPLYGKGKKTPSRYLERRGLGKVIERDAHQRVRLRTEYAGWKQFNSPLSLVSTNIGTEIPSWINLRHKETKKPLTVLDWGCGDGTTIEQLAERFDRSVHAYGYDHHSHKEWLQSPRVKYIHNDAMRMLRYVKKGSMDLIYSHYGITHFLFEQPLPERIRYLQQLAERLKPGGLFTMNFDSKHETHIRSAAQALQRLLGKRYYVEFFIHPATTKRLRYLHIQRIK